MTQPRHRTSGFTLVEVLAALAISGLIVAGLTASTIAAIRANATSRRATAAATLLHDQIEQLRALDPTDDPEALRLGRHEDPRNPLTPLGTGGGRFYRQWVVSDDAPSPGLLLVRVRVAWGPNLSREVAATTYVCKTTTCR